MYFRIASEKTFRIASDLGIRIAHRSCIARFGPLSFGHKQLLTNSSGLVFLAKTMNSQRIV